MKTKINLLSLILGIAGIILIGFFITEFTITGAVIGTNSTSQFLGLIGVVLMVIAVVIERHELRKHHLDK